MKQKMRKCAFLPVWLLVWAGCAHYAAYTPDPEKDVRAWVANLSRQRSFRYEYETRMMDVHVQGAGRCVIGRGEQVRVRWDGPSGVQELEYVGLGDVEYARSGGEWRRGSRGEQSDVLTQVRRILIAEEYDYRGLDVEGGYQYHFKANVPFLAPLRRKEMVGVLSVAADNYLPSYIWAGLPDSSVYWTVRIFKYNADRAITPPVRERQAFLITSPTAAGGCAALERRLELAGVDYQLRRHGPDCWLSVPAHYTQADIEDLVRPGGLSVYEVAVESAAARSTRYLMGDPNRPVLVSDVLLTERDVASAAVRFDRRTTPYLALKLRQKHALPRTLAFEVDSVLVATATIDTTAKLDRIDVYPDMSYHEIEFLRARMIEPLGRCEVRLQAE